MNPAFSHARFQASMPEGGWPGAFGVVTACNPDGVTVSEAAERLAGGR